MNARLLARLPALLLLATLAVPAIAAAQSKGQPKPQTSRQQPQPPQRMQIGGYAMLGNFGFAAVDSFEAILGSASGAIFGGGARVGLPFGGLFVDIGAWRFKADGERVFVVDDQVYPLGIPTRIAVTPLEISGGWRFRMGSLPRITPYIAGGFSSVTYSETSDFATNTENVEDTFAGYHLLGGAEYKLTRWIGVAAEGTWTTVPDALGDGGVSKAFGETDLGGASFRFKITIGR